MRFVLASLTVLAATIAFVPSARAAQHLEKAFLGPAEVNGTSQFPLYHDLGVTVLEQSLNWVDVAKARPADPTNPNDPAYAWPASLDQTMAEAQQNGIQVLLMVGQTPRWANGDLTSNYAPTDPNDYRDFLTAASRRYPAVRRWMIWIEPCRAANFFPITPQPIGKPLTATEKRQVRKYAEVLDAGYTGLKAANPANVVIGGNTWSVCNIRPLDWVRYMVLPNGKRPRMDLYGHNPYGMVDRRTPLPARDNIVEIRDLPRLQKAIDRYFGRPGGKRIGIWISEFAIPTGPDTSFNFHVSLAKQRKWTAEALRIARSVPTVMDFAWIFMYDTPPGHHLGLIQTDGTKKPAYYAFKNG
jgi:hypothetical protein